MCIIMHAHGVSLRASKGSSGSNTAEQPKGKQARAQGGKEAHAHARTTRRPSSSPPARGTRRKRRHSAGWLHSTWHSRAARSRISACTAPPTSMRSALASATTDARYLPSAGGGAVPAAAASVLRPPPRRRCCSKAATTGSRWARSCGLLLRNDTATPLCDTAHANARAHTQLGASHPDETKEALLNSLSVSCARGVRRPPDSKAR